jgi:uncharacterized membrane protein YfcA
MRKFKKFNFLTIFLLILCLLLSFTNSSRKHKNKEKDIPIPFDYDIPEDEITPEVEIKSNSKQENSCRVQEDCDELNICIDGFCKHKKFFPVTGKEVIGAVLIFIGSALSNAGGIGGGGLLVPILILFLNFNTKEAIPISKLMIFTGALTAFIMGIRNKNPYRDATAIDFNIAVVVIPLVLFGTMIGVTMNKIFPPWMILICLTIILIINTYKTLKK